MKRHKEKIVFDQVDHSYLKTFDKNKLYDQLDSRLKELPPFTFANSLKEDSNEST